jgi:hypothetical protein
MARWIDGLSFADQPRPPARLSRHRMGRCDILIPGQRMADQDRIRFVGVEGAIGFIGKFNRCKGSAAIQPNRPQQLCAPVEAETPIFTHRKRHIRQGG